MKITLTDAGRDNVYANYEALFDEVLTTGTTIDGDDMNAFWTRASSFVTTFEDGAS